MKYRITHAFGEAILTLEAESGNDRNPVQLRPASTPASAGDEITVQEIELQFFRKHGPFGHIFTPEMTSPYDLDHVLKQLPPKFTVEILEGAELVQSYDPDIPEGAIT